MLCAGLWSNISLHLQLLYLGPSYFLMSQAQLSLAKESFFLESVVHIALFMLTQTCITHLHFSTSCPRCNYCKGWVLQLQIQKILAKSAEVVWFCARWLLAPSASLWLSQLYPAGRPTLSLVSLSLWYQEDTNSPGIIPRNRKGMFSSWLCEK
jgi:hypothetical protein